MKMVTRIVAALSLVMGAAEAQPSYEVRYLGPANSATMNERGDVVGMTTSFGDPRAYVSVGGAPLELLPLPQGMISSVAYDINDLGVIVGVVSETCCPVDFPLAVVWTPGGAGYEAELLGQLPGHGRSWASGINNLGDIVGASIGQYRSPVLWSGPGQVRDLSATGIFDPSDINDRRVVAARQSKRLHLDTMAVDDLGVPPGSFLAADFYDINESNQCAGVAVSTSGDNCDRYAARYTDVSGWEVLSSCGQWNQSSGLNDLGDTIMRRNVDNYVRLEGLGTFRVEDLIDASQGRWYVINAFGIDINNARQMAVIATDNADRSGAVLLTPIEPCGGDFNGDGAVNTLDVLAFLNAWNTGDPRSDFNGDGAIDTRDVLTFLNAWTAGC